MESKNRWKRYFRREMDAEFFACVHGITMIFLYGLGQWLCNRNSILFATVIQMIVLVYLISWFQKLLFLSDRTYKRTEFLLRSAIWCIGPLVMTFLTGYWFHWFSSLPIWIPAAFYIILLLYFIMMWFVIQSIYKEDTTQLNELLADFKRRT